MPLSRGSSQPRDQTSISCVSFIAGRFFTAEPLGKPSAGQFVLLINLFRWGGVVFFALGTLIFSASGPLRILPGDGERLWFSISNEVLVLSKW